MFKFLKRAVIAISALTASAYFVGSASQYHKDFLRYKTEDTVVRVLSPMGGGGTGFQVVADSGTKYIVTNHHVCEAAVNDVVIIKNNLKIKKGVKKKVVYRDDIHDLCLIEGDNRLGTLKVSNSPYVGQINYIVGHPKLRDLTIFEGEYIGRHKVEMMVSAETRESCQGRVEEVPVIISVLFGIEFACIKTFDALSLTTPSYPGNSGSPILDKFGRVIGVLFAGSRTEEFNNSGVPAEYLKRVLEKY